MITNSRMKRFCREMRKQMTPAEAILWNLLRRKQLDGRKFRRQHVLGPYVLDFYCHSERLAVELDGEIHKMRAAKEKDGEREGFLKRVGIRVLRFENKDLFDNPNGVAERIRNTFGGGCGEE